MKNPVVLVCALLLMAGSASSQERYAKVRISLSSTVTVSRLAATGIALDHVGGKPGSWVDVFVSQYERALLDNQSIPYTVLIDDWRSYYALQRAEAMQSNEDFLAGSGVGHFHLGTMGGYLTLDEVAAELDSMRRAYPSNISARDSIGSSVQGRAIWAVKISQNADLAVPEPRALFTALHHAREPESIMQLVYFMWYLLENYGADAEVTNLLDHRELYFVPVVNPDGYAYNDSTDPNGGGFWRKNRRDNGDGTFGVDLNRNYGFQWGFDNLGSSSFTGSEVYRGVSAFSEPETRAIRDFCTGKNFTVALNYHTFGDDIVLPWGYTDSETRDSITFRRMADDLTARNYYVWGTGTQTVGYTTNGDSDDWMYGDTTARPHIIAMTPEVGTGSDGFWPMPSRILPLAQENLRPNLYLAHAAGEFITIQTAYVQQRRTSDTIFIPLTFQNKGMEISSPAIDVSFASSDVTLLDSNFASVPWQNTPALTIRALRDPHRAWGDQLMIAADIRYPDGLTEDTILFRQGVPDTLYADDAESKRSLWTSTGGFPGMQWDTTLAQSHSPTHSYTESPGGNYTDNLSSQFTLTPTFQLYGVEAELRFWGKWDIEGNYDYAAAEISTDLGTSWSALAGKFTRPGTGQGVQITGSPVYDRRKPDWVEEAIDLRQYVGKEVKLRFSFQSDPGVTYDGMNVDDIHLLLYPFGPDAVEEQAHPATFLLEQNYPNPFNPSTNIGFRIAQVSWVTLKVYDVLGREVTTLVDEKKSPGRYTIQFRPAGLASGIYFYRLTAEGLTQIRKLVFIK